jgi:sigma-B regulation protein RsbU (phosphoserine phosphatase)
VDLNEAQSIMSLKLRSIICVPLRAKSHILGVLYIDSDRPDQRYTHEDMLLATAVGSSAGLALENAEMHQQMLEKQRIEHEIATAWTIQQGFLVKDWPEDDIRYQVFGETSPAKTVGGDFFDFVQLSADTVGLLIGDVSGKGVPAALTMAQVLAEFRLQARACDTPADVLAALNNALVERSQHGMFCTLCYMTLELDSGAGVCANAGHHPILRLRDDGISFFGGASGPPVGILVDHAWTNEKFRLPPGETLLLYTDGILEARRARSTQQTGVPPEEFEEEGLTLTAGACFGAHPRELLNKVNDAVLGFCAPDMPHDDRTMIAMRYCGNLG